MKKNIRQLDMQESQDYVGQSEQQTQKEEKQQEILKKNKHAASFCEDMLALVTQSAFGWNRCEPSEELLQAVLTLVPLLIFPKRNIE